MLSKNLGKLQRRDFNLTQQLSVFVSCRPQKAYFCFLF